MDQRLLVISPVRNEAAHIEVVARAMAAQTRRPTVGRRRRRLDEARPRSSRAGARAAVHAHRPIPRRRSPSGKDRLARGPRRGPSTAACTAVDWDRSRTSPSSTATRSSRRATSRCCWGASPPTASSDSLAGCASGRDRGGRARARCRPSPRAGRVEVLHAASASGDRRNARAARLGHDRRGATRACTAFRRVPSPSWWPCTTASGGAPTATAGPGSARPLRLHRPLPLPGSRCGP